MVVGVVVEAADIAAIATETAIRTIARTTTALRATTILPRR